MRIHKDKVIKCGDSLKDLIKIYGKNHFKEDLKERKDYNLSYLHSGILFNIIDEQVISISVF